MLRQRSTFLWHISLSNENTFVSGNQALSSDVSHVLTANGQLIDAMTDID